MPEQQRQYGRYYLLYRFATGGMANIYLARFTGPDGFEKLVAIKRIHEHLSSNPTFLAMFKDEARLAGRISHPNVAQIIELGEQDGYYFIAMEYVDGESLSALIRRTEVPWAVGARIIADALAGLHAAHELRNAAGELLHLVHRDLSPSNVLIGYDGAVKVVDFGVARARGMLHTTETGVLKGKFAYMSPEQARNKPLDRRSDIFAAGILLYEVTTRRRLFRGDTDAGSIDLVLRGKVPPPSSVLRPYPRRLERVVLRALQRDPAKRFGTSREMQVAIEECIFSGGSPVLTAAVGDLMREVFADQIEVKRRFLQQSAEESGGAAPYYDVIATPSSVGGMPVASPQSPTASVRRRPPPVPGAPRPEEVACLDSGVEELVIEVGDAGTHAEWEAPEELVPRQVSPSGEMPVLSKTEPRGVPELDRSISDEADSGVLRIARNHRRLFLLAMGGGIALAGLVLALGRRGHQAATHAPGRSIEDEMLVSASPPGAVIRVDGKRVPNPHHLKRSAAPGEITLQVEAPGHEPRQLQLSTSQPGGVRVALRPLAQPPDAGVASPDSARRARPAEPRTRVKRSPRVDPLKPAVSAPQVGPPAPRSKRLFGNPYED